MCESDVVGDGDSIDIERHVLLLLVSLSSS